MEMKSVETNTNFPPEDDVDLLRKTKNLMALNQVNLTFLPSKLEVEQKKYKYNILNQ